QTPSSQCPDRQVWPCSHGAPSGFRGWQVSPSHQAVPSHTSVHGSPSAGGAEHVGGSRVASQTRPVAHVFASPHGSPDTGLPTHWATISPVSSNRSSQSSPASQGFPRQLPPSGTVSQGSSHTPPMHASPWTQSSNKRFSSSRHVSPRSRSPTYSLQIRHSRLA